MTTTINGLIIKVAATVIAGFILALLVAECRETRATHDAVIRLEALQNAQKQKEDKQKDAMQKRDDDDEVIIPHNEN